MSFDQPCHQTPLPIAEIFLAIAFKDFGGGETGGILDRRIAVDEGEVEAPREASADRRLADAHQADKDNRFIKAFDEILHSLGLYMGMHGRAKGRDLDPLTHWKPMPRGVIFLIILVLLLIGGAYFLSSSAQEVPLTKIEADVSRAPTAQ